MSNDETEIESSPHGLSTASYVIAVICLGLGISIGYLVRGGPSQQPATAPATTPAGAPAEMAAMQQQPTPEQMKQMADKQAETLLASLKQNPNDPEVFYKIGNIYYDTRQFPDAVKYYEQSLKLKPAADVRTDMATAYYFMGDADRAIAEFDEVLKQNPKHANALFNEGMVKWEGKGDISGAIVSWKKLLASNPDYPKREQVETLIAKAEAHTKMAPGTKTDKPARVQ
jgi:cytochrome c-type biogenesis protein CcmH/NrfG